MGHHETGGQREREIVVLDSFSLSPDEHGLSDEDSEENIIKINELYANETGNTSWPENIEPVSEKTGNVLKRVKRCGGGRRRRRNNNNNNNNDNDDDDDSDANRSRRARRRRARRARARKARKARKVRKRAHKSSSVTTTITTRIKRAFDSQSELLVSDTDEKTEQSTKVSRTGYKWDVATDYHPLA